MIGNLTARRSGRDVVTAGADVHGGTQQAFLAAVGAVVDVHALDGGALAEVDLPPVSAGVGEAACAVGVRAGTGAPVAVGIAVDGAVGLAAPTDIGGGGGTAGADTVDTGGVATLGVVSGEGACAGSDTRVEGAVASRQTCRHVLRVRRSTGVAADVRLGAVAGSVVPVLTAAPDLSAVLVASAVATRSPILPVVRLAIGPVLVVRCSAISPHEAGGLDKAADALVAVVGAASLARTVVVTDPGAGAAVLINQGVEQLRVVRAVQGGEVATADDAVELGLGLGCGARPVFVRGRVVVVGRASTADVRLAAVAAGVVPVGTAVPGLSAVLVASAVAHGRAVLPVVRLAAGPVLVVGRGGVGPDEGLGKHLTGADTDMTVVSATGLEAHVVVADPGSVARDEGIESISVGLAVR